MIFMSGRGGEQTRLCEARRNCAQLRVNHERQKKEKNMIKIKGANRTKGTEVKGIPQPKQKNGAK